MIYILTTDQGQHIGCGDANRVIRKDIFVDRSLYYASRAIVKQGVKGEWDYHLAPVYTVCFMNFNIESRSPEKFRTDVCLVDAKKQDGFSLIISE